MIRCSILLTLLIVAVPCLFSQQKSLPPAPPNAPAQVELKDDAITIRYNGRVIFSGTMSAGGVKVHERTQVYHEG